MAEELTRFEILHTIASRAGQRVGVRYQGVLTISDATQEAWRWLLAHPERIDRATINGVVNRPRVYAEVARYLVDFANRERQRVLGVNPDDEARYTHGMVEAILPHVWGDLGRPANDSPKVGRSVADPAVGGDWLALQVDVSRGVKLLDKTQRAVLFLRFGQGESWTDTAQQVELTVDGARKRARRAVGVIVDYLNGLHPDDAQWGGPGSRRAIPNALSQWITREQYAPPGGGAY